MEFYLAPVGRGKTDAVLSRILQTKARAPFASVWALLATQRQSLDFRRRLLTASPDQRVFFNVETFTFYQLYQQLLLMAGKPQRSISESARAGLIAVILRDLAARGDLPIFAPIAHTPGLARILLEFIYELKQSLIDVEPFAAAAEKLAIPKAIELARIYAAYQRLLISHDLVDREGEGWLALSTLAENDSLGTSIDLLVCDGYDQFNPMQARLLVQLSTRARETLTTLTTVPDREETVGLRFKRALDRLLACCGEENVYPDLHWELFNTDALPRPGGEPLAALAENLFHPAAKPITVKTETVTRIEAPDPAVESAALLRRIKKLLLNGESPENILIAVRDLTLYAKPLRTAAQRFGIPIAIQGEPMVENPAIAAFISLLDLHAADFPRRDLIDALTSPYTRAGFTSQTVDHLDRQARAAYVTGGRADLIGCVRALSSDMLSDDDEDRTTSAVPLDEAAADILRAQLTHFLDGITPPPQATFTEFIQWIETLIGEDNPALDPDDAPPDPALESPPFTLDMIAAIRADASELTARDLAALSDFKRLLERMMITRHLIAAVDPVGSSAIPWADFWAEVNRTLVGVHTRGDSDAPARHGRVLITSVNDARGLPHAHVFVPGLSEGIFPAPTPEDPLLLDGERRRFCALEVPLKTADDRGDDDGLFYELVNLATHSLTISRFTGKDGSPVLESHLWGGVVDILPNSTHIHLKPGDAVPSSDAADLSEVMIAAPVDASAAAWLKITHPQRWTQLDRGWRVEQTRMLSHMPHDQFSGVLTHPTLTRYLAQHLGADRVWSASQLTDYGKCPFRFYARRLLKLEQRKDPEDGMDNLQYGNVVHELLEKVYLRIDTIDATAESAILELVDREAAKMLPSAPERYSFQRPALWREESVAIVRQVKRLIKADLNDKFKIAKNFEAVDRRPYKLESPFSDDKVQRGAIPLQIGDQTIRVTGKIDRIDRISTSGGDRLIVMDYKTGTKPIPNSEIERGRVFQMMIYLMALEAMRASDPSVPPVAGGMFVHVSNELTSGVLNLSIEKDQASMEQGIAQLSTQLKSGRSGNFAARATASEAGRCSTSCEFLQFCRMSVTYRKKALPT